MMKSSRWKELFRNISKRSRMDRFFNCNSSRACFQYGRDWRKYLCWSRLWWLRPMKWTRFPGILFLASLRFFPGWNSQRNGRWCKLSCCDCFSGKLSSWKNPRQHNWRESWLHTKVQDPARFSDRFRPGRKAEYATAPILFRISSIPWTTSTCWQLNLHHNLSNRSPRWLKQEWSSTMPKSLESKTRIP